MRLVCCPGNMCQSIAAVNRFGALLHDGEDLRRRVCHSRSDFTALWSVVGFTGLPLEISVTVSL